MPIDPHPGHDLLDLPELLTAAVAVGLAEQSASALLDWLVQDIADFVPQGSPLESDPDLLRAFAFSLGRAVWNALPLPRRGFLTEPLPEPGRNDACPCGSGRKYKQCCQRAPTLDVVTTPLLWPMVLHALDGQQRAAALASRHLPREALLEFLDDELEDGREAVVIEILEPRFGEPPAATDALAADLLDVLCDAYERKRGGKRRKRALLDRLGALPGRSQLKATALQRLAAIAMDEDRAERAWRLFQEAQRCAPQDPALGVLEVQLLYAEGRMDEVRARAAFHRAQFTRRRDPNDAEAIAFFDRMAWDPERAMSDVVLRMEGGAGQGLADWLDRVRDRAVPAYRIEPLGAGERDGNECAGVDAMTRSLRQLGLSGDELASARDDALAQLGRMAAETAPDESGNAATPVGAEPPAVEVQGATLEPPPALRTVEAQWHECCPLAKPFSIHPLPRDDDGVWDEEVEETWARFLGAHPEAFDSLDILDDLATAVFLHPGAEHEALFDRFLAPLILRSCAIVDAALAATPGVTLPWIASENRPALRALFREHERQRILGHDDVAMARAEQMIALNPGDNHGLRFVLTCQYLANDRPERCAALASRYPEDHAPETLFNAALAHYQLGAAVTATAALQAAHAHLPNVARYLLPSRVSKPAFSAYGVAVGGEDQAWLYRQAMRDVWKRTPGALQWATKVLR